MRVTKEPCPTCKTHYIQDQLPQRCTSVHANPELVKELTDFYHKMLAQLTQHDTYKREALCAKDGTVFQVTGFMEVADVKP
jgi:hypothetical protein